MAERIWQTPWPEAAAALLYDPEACPDLDGVTEATGVAA
jgi:hypothetical protein